LQSYGSIEASSKSVADRYVGWFDGEAEDLLPVTKEEMASNMVRDFGRETILARARDAYAAGDYRWAATLASYVWRAENQTRNDALYWRTQALKRLAENFMGIQLRQYLYSTAIADWGFTDEQLLPRTKIYSRPLYLGLHTIENCFELLAQHVDPKRAEGVDQTIDLRLTDDPKLSKNQVSYLLYGLTLITTYQQI
jgi:alkyl sulfatase BDS1-like metallo-beta-lactamase superfamily hydrolase